MSLVVCKKIDNKIYIESDSRVTDINAAKNESVYGVLKTIILYPQLCICFAGNIYIAEKAISEIFNHKNVTLPYLLNLLLKYNIEAQNGVEFILCTIRNNSTEIIKISNSTVERKLATAWIGDIAGFKIFQKNFHELRNFDKGEVQCLNEAFAKVIDSAEIDTVGDFQISAHTDTTICLDGWVFQYTEKALVMCQGEMQKVVGSETEQLFKITWGSAAGGSYGISYFISVTPCFHAVALYFAYGNFGVLFCPKISFEGIIISDTTNIEFVKTINEKYNIPLRGFVFRDNSAFQLIDMRMQ